MVSFGFSNVLGWFAFLSLIPLIILYLIKPKPRQIEVPSLMFFQEHLNSTTERAFFKKLTKDWLFWLQLLALLLMSLFFIKPYVVLSQPFLLDDVVLVVDISASTSIDGIIDDVMEEAKGLLGKSNTVILVSSEPRVGVEGVDKASALAFLDRLAASPAASPLGEALRLAGKYAGAGAHVFVVSDFINTGKVTLDAARSQLEEKGVVVQFIDVGRKKEYNNVGIVKAKPGEGKSEVSAKNFGNQPVTMDVLVNTEKRTLTINPGAVEVISFESIPGVNEVRLDISDDFDMDNSVFLSIPLFKEIRVFLLSHSPSLYLQAALTASPHIKLDSGPSLPSQEYDVYVLNNIRSLSQEDTHELRKRVNQGAGLVFHAQENMDAFSYGDLLPVVLGSKQGYGVIQETQPNKLTQSISFGGVQHYFSARDNKGVTLASVGDSPLLALMSYGEGKIFYYGVLEDANNFYLDPSYPIFWVTLVKHLGNLKGVADLNKKGGNVLSFSREKIMKTPRGTLITKALYLDDAGVYDIDGEKVAVNLLNEEESSLSPSSFTSEALNAQTPERGAQQQLGQLLLLLTVLVVLLELFIIKARGEL